MISRSNLKAITAQEWSRFTPFGSAAVPSVPVSFASAMRRAYIAGMREAAKRIDLDKSPVDSWRAIMDAADDLERDE